MMNRKASYVLCVCVVVFAASLAGTIAARSQPSSEEKPGPDSPLARWLDLDGKSAEGIESLDPGFSGERKSLQEELSDARSALATLLEDEDVTNEAIQEQIEACIVKHNALERRVAQYLLTVRDHLTPAQQKKLFRLCAEGVRKGRGHRWGRGAGPGSGRSGDRCECCGRGGGQGRGRGQGRDEAHNHDDD